MRFDGLDILFGYSAGVLVGVFKPSKAEVGYCIGRFA